VHLTQGQQPNCAARGTGRSKPRFELHQAVLWSLTGTWSSPFDHTLRKGYGSHSSSQLKVECVLDVVLDTIGEAELKAHPLLHR